MSDPRPTESTAPNAPTASWREPKRLAISLVGFAAGLGLLAWVIVQAVNDEKAHESWERFLNADPWLVAALFACTLASSVVNALSFQLTARPVGGVSGWDLQRLNFVAGLANYAPVRLGPLARIGFHLNVDRMKFLTMSAWFAVMAVMVILVIAPAITATLARPKLDLIWGGLLVVQVVIVVYMLRWSGSLIFSKHGRDVDRILQAPGVLWGAAALRLADVAAFWGRMAAASAILGMELDAGELLMLALLAYVGSLVPFGRAGFQQFLVASGAIGLDASAMDSGLAQLALLESAAEFAFYLVTGAPCLLWYRSRMTRAAAERRASRDASDPDAAAPDNAPAAAPATGTAAEPPAGSTADAAAEPDDPRR